MWWNGSGTGNGEHRWRFNAARGFLCGGTPKNTGPLPIVQFQCRTRLSMWWNIDPMIASLEKDSSFNAARGFLCGGTLGLMY